MTAYDGNAAPVALADSVRTVAVGAPVVLDASASFDPDGGALAFRWSFASVPAQSVRGDDDLIDARSATARFAPDVAGDYVLRLQVGDGELVSEARTLVHARAGVLPPDAEPRAIVRGDRIVLDATPSADTNAVPRPLNYGWGLVARPGASFATQAAIADEAAAHASFMPDVDGDYVFRLRASNGAAEDARNVRVRFARVRAGDKARASASSTTVPGARARKQGDSDPTSSAGVVRLALNLHPRALDVTAGGQGTIDVRLVASGRASDDDDPHGLERNNKSRSSGVRASLVASGLPPGVDVRFADADLVPDVPCARARRHSKATWVTRGRRSAAASSGAVRACPTSWTRWPISTPTPTTAAARSSGTRAPPASAGTSPACASATTC